MRCSSSTPAAGPSKTSQPNEERLGLARGLAVVAAGAAPLAPDPFGRLCPATTAEHVLQRADARTATTDAVAEKSVGDCRAGSLVTTDISQPCPDSGLVEPDMPKIRARFNPWKTRQHFRFKKKSQETESKEQQGSSSAPAIVTMD